MPRSNKFGVKGLHWDSKRNRFVFYLRERSGGKHRVLVKTTAPQGFTQEHAIEWARRKLAEHVIPRHSVRGLRFPLADDHPKKSFSRHAAHRLDTAGVVYVIRATDGGPVKIGWAVNLVRRMESLQIGNPDELRVLASWRGTMRDEKMIHWRHRHEWKRGEWFQISDEALAVMVACDEPCTREGVTALRRKRAMVFVRVGEEQTGMTHYRRMRADEAEAAE